MLSLYPWSGCKKLEPCTDHPGGSIFPPPRCGCSWAFASPLVWCVAEPSGRLSDASSSCRGMLGSTAVLGAVGWHRSCSLRVPEGHVGRGTGLLQPLGKERCRGGLMDAFALLPRSGLCHLCCRTCALLDIFTEQISYLLCCLCLRYLACCEILANII